MNETRNRRLKGMAGRALALVITLAFALLGAVPNQAQTTAKSASAASKAAPARQKNALMQSPQGSEHWH